MSFVVTVKGDPLAIVCETKGKARELRKFLREAGYAKSDITIVPRDESGNCTKTKSSRAEILASKTPRKKHH